MDIVAQWRACASLHSFQQLTSLGWSMSVRQYARTVNVLCVLMLITLGGVAAFSFDLVDGALLTNGPVDGEQLALIYVAANGYILSVGVCREVLSRRRDVVAHPANVAFYRAMDLSAAVGFAIWVLGPLARKTAVWLVVSAAFIAAFHAEIAVGVGSPLSLLALPIAGGALQAAVAGWMACTPAAAAKTRRWLVLALAAVVFGSSRLLGVVLWGDPAATISVVPSSIGPEGVSLVLELAIACVLIGATATIGLQVRALSRRSFPVWQSAAGLARRPRLVDARGPATWLALAVIASLARGRAGRSHSRMISGLALAAAATAGLGPVLSRAAAAGLEHSAGAVTLSIAFVAALSLAEIDVSTTGPTSLSRHMRTAWELGAPRPALVATVSAGVAAVPALSGWAVSVVRWPLGGALDAGPIVVATAVGAAALLADVLAPPRTNADGSTTPSISAAALTVLLAVPVIALIAPAERSYNDNSWRVWGAVALVGILFAGGMACVSRLVAQGQSTSTR